MGPSTGTVGFVGLGKMGWPMARNLAKAGYSLVVRDADPGQQARFTTKFGAVTAGTPEAFAVASVVVTMLPDDKAVREAMLEWEGGIGRSLRPGALVIDMSSSNPEGTTALAAELEALGISLVDAPVSGGVRKAESGTLTLMIGGDDEEVERGTAVLGVLGERLFRTGPVGSGHAMKALNNFVGGATYTVVVEALAIGRRFGLEPGTMIDVMNASTGRSFNSEVVVKEHVLTEAYATGFALGLLAKDVGIAASLARSAGVDAPVCELVSSRWAEAAGELGSAADHSEAHKNWWPERLGQAVEAER